MTMNSIVISDVQHDNVIRAFLFLFAFHVKTLDQSRIYHIKYSNSCHTTIVYCNYFSCVLHSIKMCNIQYYKACNHLSKPSHNYIYRVNYKISS